jgi:hypothetical protein
LAISALVILSALIKRASLLVRLIIQNKGKLAKNKRDLFSEITDEELEKIESAIAIVDE